MATAAEEIQSSVKSVTGHRHRPDDATVARTSRLETRRIRPRWPRTATMEPCPIDRTSAAS